MSSLNRVNASILIALVVSIFGAPSYAYAKSETCRASWYGPGFQGKKMANGERFNMNDASIVAHKSYAFGTKLRVTNLKTGKSITTEVQDRGPYVGGRCVDLSKAAATELGIIAAGTGTVLVEKL